MHQPRPHGTFGTDGDEDAAALELLARRLTNVKDLSGLGSLRMSRTLPSGAMAIAQDMGGVFKVIVQPRPQESPVTEPNDGLAEHYIPMLFSGVIKKAVVRPGEGVEIELSEQARRRLSGYDPEAALPPKQVKLQRFRVDYNFRCSELKPKDPGAFLHSQYAAQRPTWYSGAMAEVIQVVGGYGRQDFEALPKDRVERARMALPPRVQLGIESELGSLRLPGYTGVPNKKGEFQYDYKFGHTNGVGFDPDGKPWLLRVVPSGVFAMPLPLVPATTVPTFRTYVSEEVGDDELLWALNRFGGLPSGEGMPADGDDFEAWRRAGVIIKVCDSADFYRRIMYSSACGWAFNASGTEGFNTCYDYDDDKGLGFGLAYKLSLRLGPAKDAGRLPAGFHLDDPLEARTMDDYLSSLWRELGAGGARELAIKYKLTRSLPQVLERMGKVRDVSYDPDAEVDYWDNLEAEPIAAHSGSVNQVGRGWLYHGAAFIYQPQIKFPEPFAGCCLSHNFSPLLHARNDSSYPRCDTVMYGYYIGEQLKVVKYFWDDRTFSKDVQDNSGECMTVGSFERTETTGSTSLVGNFYTTDFDDRGELPEAQTVTKTVGTDLGYDTKPWFEFDFPFSSVGTLWRNRYFQHKTIRSSTEGHEKSVAVCVPFFARNAVLHAVRESTTGARVTNSRAIYSITDPNSYRFYTWDFVFAWKGGSTKGNVASVTDVSPSPKDGDPVWVMGYNHNPAACSDFADQGDWMGGLPQDYTWLIHPDKNAWAISGGGGAPTTKSYSTSTTEPKKVSGHLQASTLRQTGEVNKDPARGYFESSPSEIGVMFYVDAIKNVAGDAEYANASEADPAAPKQRKRWGFTRLADHKSAHHFIGVINE